MRIRNAIYTVLLAASSALAQTGIPLSNLGQPTGGSYSALQTGDQWAVGFTTGNSSNYLSQVSIAWAGWHGDMNAPVPVSVWLAADAGGLPGAQWAALVSANGSAYPTNAGTVAYNPAAPLVTLSPNTSYWLVAATTGTPDFSDYTWSETALTNLDAGSTWTLGASAYYNGLGGVWIAANNFHLLFSVSAIPVAPPVLALSQPVVITYPNIDAPYVLQQNADLNTSNWITATNILLSGVLSNQAVFILPPNGQNLFYRLKLP